MTVSSRTKASVLELSTLYLRLTTMSSERLPAPPKADSGPYERADFEPGGTGGVGAARSLLKNWSI
jgi:hypothetical protein